MYMYIYYDVLYRFRISPWVYVDSVLRANVCAWWRRRAAGNVCVKGVKYWKLKLFVVVENLCWVCTVCTLWISRTLAGERKCGVFGVEAQWDVVRTLYSHSTVGVMAARKGASAITYDNKFARCRCIQKEREVALGGDDEEKTTRRRIFTTCWIAIFSHETATTTNIIWMQVFVRL